MEPSRRKFLISLTAAFAAPAIVKATSLMPIRAYLATIYGDGIHDDAEGINALLRGDKVKNFAGLRWDGAMLHFPERTCRIESPIFMPVGTGMVGDPNRFTKLTGRPELNMSTGNRIENFWFQSDDPAGPGVTITG